LELGYEAREGERLLSWYPRDQYPIMEQYS
jgi:hypothetical protein